MIEVAVNINREVYIGAAQAVRIYPTNRKPEIGEMCKYALYFDTEESEEILEFPYGDGMKLAEAMLRAYNRGDKDETV